MTPHIYIVLFSSDGDDFGPTIEAFDSLDGAVQAVLKDAQQMKEITGHPIDESETAIEQMVRTQKALSIMARGARYSWQILEKQLQTK